MIFFSSQFSTDKDSDIESKGGKRVRKSQRETEKGSHQSLALSLLIE